MRARSIAVRLLCIAAIGLVFPVSLSATKLFEPAQVYRSDAGGANSIVVADLNGDGKPDLVIATGCSSFGCNGGVGVLFGNGDGTFQAAQTLGTGFSYMFAVAVADVNGDGKPDIIATNGGGYCDPACIDYVVVLLGNGDGTFEAPVSFPSVYNTSALAVADVNGDGKPDLLVTSQFADPDRTQDGAVTVFLGNGDGSFGIGQSYDAGSPSAWATAVGDLNGDGKLDLAVATSYYLEILLGNGDGSFEMAQNTATRISGSIMIADVNADGKADVLETAGCGIGCKSEVGLLLGNGDGTFQAEQFTWTGASAATSPTVADVNGDGIADVIVVHELRGSRQGSPVTVFLGNGDGTFSDSPRLYSGAAYANSVATADVNGDGKPDLLIGSQCFSSSDCSTGAVSVMLGTAGVKTTTTLTSSLNPSSHGQAVTFTATVTSSGPTPAGNVTFKDGTKGLKTVVLNGGVAAFTTTKLAVGTHQITAGYKGNFNSAKSTSSVLSQVVQ